MTKVLSLGGMILECNDAKPEAAWREISLRHEVRTYGPDFCASFIDIGSLTPGGILQEKYVPWITQMMPLREARIADCMD